MGKGYEKQLDEKEGILIEEIDLDREDQIREQLPLLKTPQI